MLTIGAGSTCDVCLDPFGDDCKGPCSIECGHVFCNECLDNLERPNCPLCRCQIQLRTYVRLHVEVLHNKGALEKVDPSPDEAAKAKQDASKLQAAIASVANNGSTEHRLRDLIAECKTFLSTQPREMFPDLRASHRMIAYLCEVKSKLRSQERETSDLIRERDALSARLCETDATLRMEKEENKTLRQQHLEAQRYATGLMSFLTTMMQRPDDLKKYHADYQANVNTSPDSNDRSSSTSLQTFATVTPSGDFLISPLPEISLCLAPGNMSMSSIMGEEMSFEPEDPGAAIFSPIKSRCNGAGCPFSCDSSCAKLYLSSPGSGDSGSETPVPPPLPTTPIVPVPAQSMLSLTAPSNRPSRSGSFHKTDHTPMRPSSSMRSEPVQPEHDPIQMQSRLRDLLDDNTSPPLSSSTPIHNHGRRSPSESRPSSRTGSSLKPAPLTQTYSDPIIRSSSSHYVSGSYSSSSAVASQATTQRHAVSHASTAAQKSLERVNKDEKKRRSSETKDKDRDLERYYPERPPLSRASTQQRSTPVDVQSGTSGVRDLENESKPSSFSSSYMHQHQQRYYPHGGSSSSKGKNLAAAGSIPSSYTPTLST